MYIYTYNTIYNNETYTVFTMLSNEPKVRMCVLAASASLWGARAFKSLATAVSSTQARLHRYNMYIYI